MRVTPSKAIIAPSATAIGWACLRRDRPESGGTGDQAQVRDVPCQDRIRRVRQSPLDRGVGERLPLQREPLRAPRYLRDGQSLVGQLEQDPGP